MPYRLAIPLISGGEGQIRTAEPKGTELQSAAFSHFATSPSTWWRLTARTADPLLVRQMLSQLS